MKESEEREADSERMRREESELVCFFHVVVCGEGQTKRPRAHGKGNGGAHSAGKSTVDHDKWLQIGFRNRVEQQGKRLLTPPAAENYTQHPLCSTEVTPWPRTPNCQR